MEKKKNKVLCRRDIIRLPDDILTTHILSRLPKDSLLRCSLVSKSWHHLTSSPCFLPLYRRLHPPMLGFFYNRCSPRPSPTFFPTTPMSTIHHNLQIPEDSLPLPDLTLLASSNRILLFGTDYGIRFFINKPSTQQWTSIPPLPRSTASLAWGIGLVTDQSDPPRFTVVRVGPNLTVHAFSSDRGSWEKIKSTVDECDAEYEIESPTDHEHWDIPAVNVNGVLYWRHDNSHLRVYDVRKLHSSLIRLPRERNGAYTCLDQSEGRLRYVHVDSDMYIWVLRDESVGWWRLEGSVGLREMLSGQLGLIKLMMSYDLSGFDGWGRPCVVRPVGLDSTDRHVVFLWACDGRIFSYHFGRSELKQIGIRRVFDGPIFPYQMMIEESY